MRSTGVMRPSGIAARFVEFSEKFGERPLLYFLREICIVTVMDVSFLAFDSSAELVEERTRLCESLVELDTEHAADITNELSILTRTAVLDDGLKTVDQSRVYINVEAIGPIIATKSKEGFERSRALLDAGLEALSTDTVLAATTQLTSGDSQAFLELLKYPIDEVENIIGGLLDVASQEFLSNPEHGLDSYLSTRVRHGSLEGYLRGPLEERALLLSRDGPGNRRQFVSTPEWIKNFTSEEKRLVLDAFATFTDAYDEILTDVVKNKLQVQSEQKPEGLFKNDTNRGQYLFLRSRLSADVSLDEFVGDSFVLLNARLDRSLAAVREYFNERVKQKIGQAIDRLAQQLSRRLGARSFSSVNEAINFARIDVQSALARVVGWFDPDPEQQSAYLRTLEEIVDVGIAATRSAFRSFAPMVEKRITPTERLAGDALPIFTYIVFTALDNVRKHAGLGPSPHVSIEIQAEPLSEKSKRHVRMRISNEVAAGTKCVDLERQLEKTRQMIASGAYKARVSGEGGTGLPKIQRLIAEYAENLLRFGFSDECVFFVEVEMDLIFLSSDQVKRLGAA